MCKALLNNSVSQLEVVNMKNQVQLSITITSQSITSQITKFFPDSRVEVLCLSSLALALVRWFWLGKCKYSVLHTEYLPVYASYLFFYIQLCHYPWSLQASSYYISACLYDTSNASVNVHHASCFCTSSSNADAVICLLFHFSLLQRQSGV